PPSASRTSCSSRPSSAITRGSSGSRLTATRRSPSPSSSSTAATAATPPRRSRRTCSRSTTTSRGRLRRSPRRPRRLRLVLQAPPRGRFDWALLGAMAALITLGLLMLYTATVYEDHEPFRKQAYSCAAALAVLALVVAVPYQIWSNLSLPL